MHILVCVLALLASGCTTRITGLRYEGVDLPDRLPPLRAFHSWTERVPGVLVRLSSSQNWWALHDSDRAPPNLAPQAARCRDGERDELFSLRTNDAWTTADPANMPPTPPGRFRYWVWLPLITEPWKSYRSTYVAHDLRSDTDDICLQLLGSYDMLSPFRSNTVLVPAADIRRAARAVPPP